MMPSRTTPYPPPRGRRGGLALGVPQFGGPASASPVAAPAPADARSLGPRLAQLRTRVRWTLVFAAFFAFTGVVVSSRFAIGQPLMIAGLVGLLLQPDSLRFGPVPSLLALWLGWSALGYFTTPYPDEVSMALEQLAKLTLICLVGVNALRTRGQVRAYSAFVLFAFLIYPGRGTFLNWVTGANVRFGRAIWNGVYANPNDMAGIALLIMAIAIGLAVSERDRRYRLAAAGTAAFTIFLIVLTQSRGALIALAVFVLVALKRVPRQQRTRALLATAAMGAVLAAFAPSSVWERLSGLKHLFGGAGAVAQVDQEGSAEQRYEIWKVARTIIAEHPVAGVGLGAYSMEHGVVAQRPQFKPTAHGRRDAHSTYFSVMAETGIPGFLLFVAIVATTVRYAQGVRRRLRDVLPGHAQQLLYLQLGLLAFLIAAVWGSYANLNMLYLHLVLIWASARALDAEAAAAGVAPAPRR